MLEPWRNTWSQLRTQLGWDGVRTEAAGTELLDWLEQRPLETLETMLARDINAPRSSSCGRLFDAVAGALDVCRERIHYEGQAAIELEQLAAGAADETRAYPFDLRDGTLDTAPMWRALLADLRGGIEPKRIAARFHQGLAAAITRSAAELCAERGLDTVALSGGVFQNRTLFEQVDRGLTAAGLMVLSHHQLPSNDGGISFGQALVAAARQIGDTANS
jgi:hydrogenase maturation protein HypF